MSLIQGGKLSLCLPIPAQAGVQYPVTDEDSGTCSETLEQQTLADICVCTQVFWLKDVSSLVPS